MYRGKWGSKLTCVLSGHQELVEGLILTFEQNMYLNCHFASMVCGKKQCFSKVCSVKLDGSLVFARCSAFSEVGLRWKSGFDICL